MSRPSKIIKLMKKIKPTPMWIDGKCFNISKHIDEICNIAANSSSCEENKTNYNINFTNHIYQSSFRLPCIYYDKLRTFSDFTIKELEKETDTNIDIPQDSTTNCVIVSSKNIENVIDARTKLHCIVSLIRDKQSVLQFLSIPIKNNDVKTKFKELKSQILEHGKEIDGMHESIFQKPERLHLTIGVLSLLDDIETAEAIKVLNDCKEKIIDPIVCKNGPLKIKICGLECMNSDYTKANILYANAKVCVGDEDILQSIANSISNYFHERGLIRQYQENVKMHMTLINTKYRKIEGRKRKWKDRKNPFNATTIMEKYREYDFGECEFSQLHLSWIAKIDDVDGFYKPVSLITL